MTFLVVDGPGPESCLRPLGVEHSGAGPWLNRLRVALAPDGGALPVGHLTSHPLTDRYVAPFCGRFCKLEIPAHPDFGARGRAPGDVALHTKWRGRKIAACRFMWWE